MRKPSRARLNAFRRFEFKPARKSKKRAPRPRQFEALESRLVFSTTHFPTGFLPGPCDDSCPCKSQQVRPTRDDNATTDFPVGDM